MSLDEKKPTEAAKLTPIHQKENPGMVEKNIEKFLVSKKMQEQGTVNEIYTYVKKGCEFVFPSKN